MIKIKSNIILIKVELTKSHLTEYLVISITSITYARRGQIKSGRKFTIVITVKIHLDKFIEFSFSYKVTGLLISKTPIVKVNK